LRAPPGRDDDPSERCAEALDHAVNYAVSRVTLGLSPAALAEAYFDWLAHLAAAPSKQLQLYQKALRKTARIGAPAFAVGTETHHVAPWRSVFKLNLLLDTDVTFLLTSSGHNAGIVSEPARTDRHYRLPQKGEQDSYLDPDAWLRRTPAQQGSWGPAWVGWLAERSGAPVPAAAPGETGHAPLADAPGIYVLEP
jgi:hypothetical protein